MRAWLRRNGLTDDWVAYIIAAAFIAGLFCPYLTEASR